MSNLHHIIANKRPITRDEKYILDVYTTFAIIFLGKPLTIQAIEFLVTLMRLNDIAQQRRQNIVQINVAGVATDMNVQMYHDRISNISSSLMR